MIDSSGALILTNYSAYLCSGAVASVSEAEGLCRVLQTAGIVLRHNNIVYLKVEEISEMVSLVRRRESKYFDQMKGAKMTLLPSLRSFREGEPMPRRSWTRFKRRLLNSKRLITW